MSIPIPPINYQLMGESLKLGTTYLNAITKSVGHVTIDFPALPLYEVFSLQNSIVTEMKVREGVLVN